MYYSFYCFLIFTTAMVGSESKPTFMDAVPGVSQGKTLFLYIIGKEDQAYQTLVNFKNVTHLWESVKNIDDSIPIYGHIKGIIVGIKGDGEHAKKILEAAHKSTCIAGGFFLAGPIGGVAGSLFADSSMTIVDWKPKGTIEHIVHLKNKTSSENIDLLLDLSTSTIGSKIKGPTTSVGVQPIILEMKKTSPNSLNRRRSSAAEVGGDVAQVLYAQPITPYGSASSSQNKKKINK